MSIIAWDRLHILCRIVDLNVPLGDGEPFPYSVFLALDGNSRPGPEMCEGYYILKTDGHCGYDMKMLPKYSVFRVQGDPVFGWYFREVKL